MKGKKAVPFVLLMLLLLLLTNDTFLEKVGWRKSLVPELSGEEMNAINAELAATDFEPLLLEKVELREKESDDPMHDFELAFIFNRSLSDLERNGFGRRIYMTPPWRFSIGVKGKHELAEYDPVNTLEVAQFTQGKLELVFPESWLHPGPFRKPRQFAEYADATFQPGGLVDFQICLYQWQGFGGTTGKSQNVKMIAEWTMGDLEQVSGTEWIVPENFDPAPTPAALRNYEQNMDPLPVP